MRLPPRVRPSSDTSCLDADLHGRANNKETRKPEGPASFMDRPVPILADRELIRELVA